MFPDLNGLFAGGVPNLRAYSQVIIPCIQVP